MTQRQIKLLLSYSATSLFFAAGSIALLGMILPLKSMTTQTAASHASTNNSQEAGATESSLSSFESLFNRPLRVALGTAPANDASAPDPPPQAAAVLPALAFVGTVGDNLAMIRSADGSVAVVGIGEQVDGAQLLAIRPTQVDLRSGDGTFTLNKAAESTSDAAGPLAPTSPTESPTEPPTATTPN